MRLRHLVLVGLLPFLVAACTGPAEYVWAPDEAVKRATYAHAGPPKLTLFTVVNVRNGSSGHAGLMVNADQRILFDPAGTFALPFAPERNDVHYGMTDRALSVYIDYHARSSWNVRIQEIEVTPEQARMAAGLVQSYGAVPKAQCALSISQILAKVPGFQDIGRTYFPNTLSDQFAARPGVTTQLVTDTDADKNHNVLFEAFREFHDQ